MCEGVLSVQFRTCFGSHRMTHGITRVPISGLLAVGAVHQHLVGLKKRLQVGLIVKHAVACLPGNIDKH